MIINNSKRNLETVKELREKLVHFETQLKELKDSAFLEELKAIILAKKEEDFMTPVRTKEEMIAREYNRGMVNALLLIVEKIEGSKA